MTKDVKQIRVTIMLGSDIGTALREEQSRRLLKTNKSISFSQVINDELRKSLGLKAPKKPRKVK